MCSSDLDTNGYLVAKTTTNSGDSVGVLVGCQYVNSMGQTVEGQYYPAAASTSTALAFAYVVDDPNAVFKVVACGSSTTSTPTAYSRALVGSNVSLATATGSTATGDSYYGINGASADTTNTLPVRVIDVVPASATGPRDVAATTYYEFLVKFNTHQYNDTTGV